MSRGTRERLPSVGMGQAGRCRILIVCDGLAKLKMIQVLRPTVAKMAGYRTGVRGWRLLALGMTAKATPGVRGVLERLKAMSGKTTDEPNE